MKISKLFHWLYSALMLAPLVAILSTCAFTWFNKEIATTHQEPTINYKYETNDVNDVSDLVKGNLYHFEYNVNDLTTTKDLITADYVKINNTRAATVISYPNNTNVYFTLRLTPNQIYIYNNSWTLITNLSITNKYDLDFIYHSTSANTTDFISNISSSSYNEIEDVTFNGTNTYDIFYYAVDKTTESPLFNWAKDVFTYEPIRAGVQLFGVQSGIIPLYLSYWLNVSIIWLLFDLLMYMPMLIHRWIDKAVGGVS